MITSFIVYIGLMLFMNLCFYTNKSYLYKITLSRAYPIRYLLFPCIVFAVVFGCRYNVGVDHLSYLQNYIYDLRDYEYGFTLISDLCKKNDFHFSVFFGIIAFLQIIFFLLAFKERPYLYPYIILFLFLSCMELSWMNAIRQSLAMCLFMYSTRFIEKKEFVKFVVAIFLAIQFHASAIILLPLYWISILPISRNIWYSLIIYLVAYFISFFPVERFDLLFAKATEILGYSQQYDSQTSLVYIENEGSGLGRLIINTTFLIVILYSKRLKCFFKNDERWFNLIYNLFIIGMFGDMTFNKCVILARPFGYVKIVWIIIVAMLVYYFTKCPNKSNIIVKYTLIGLFIAIFIANIYRGSTNFNEFHFFWEY